jgi:small subunit ribosomal protein S20
MPHSKSAKKRAKQNEKRRMANKSVKSSMRTQVKKVTMAIEAGDKAAAQKEMGGAAKKLDKAAKKNVIHKNQAARRKARLQKQINELD